MKNTIQVTIMSPEAVVFTGEALALSGTNSEGTFDILPSHARFMTLIAGMPIVIHQSDGNDREFTFENAVISFKDDVAKVYVHTPI